VAGAVALAVALRLAATERAAAVVSVAALRDRLADGLLAAVQGAHRTVPRGAPVLPGHLHLCLAGVEREELLVALGVRGVCASGGSSCASGALEPSRVLAAMGVPADLAAGAVRFTLGRDTTDADIDRALEVVPEVVATLRQRA
jgi:cysteine desulfurase